MERHLGVEIPEIAIISEAEKSLVVGKNFKSKTAMQVGDMKKLNKEQIALFPVTEFWTKKQKKWKTSKIGSWAKKNSQKMKKIFGNNTFE